MTWAWYNENDLKTAAWLRELIKEGLIADGEVDTRSIVEVEPGDLAGFRQCHFFAGIGGWSYALRLAGWPDDREVWTGSCPCQPWSVAGKGQGADDPRDLWPAWRELIAQRRPPAVFGEQTPGADGLLWLDRVYVDLEAQDYAVGTADIPAASVGAPMASQRLFFVAAADSTAIERDAGSVLGSEAPRSRAGRKDGSGADGSTDGGESDHLRMASSERTGRLPVRPGRSRQATADIDGYGEVVVDWLASPDGSNGQWWSGPLQVGRNAIEAEVERGGRRYRAQWRIKPGLSMLAHGIPGRVDLLRGYGNAIVPAVAAEVIGAYMEISQWLFLGSSRQGDAQPWGTNLRQPMHRTGPNEPCPLSRRLKTGSTISVLLGSSRLSVVITASSPGRLSITAV